MERESWKGSYICTICGRPTWYSEPCAPRQAEDPIPQTYDPLMRCRLPAVRRFRRGRRCLVILEYSGNFAEETLFLLRILVRILSVRRGRAGLRLIWRRQHFCPSGAEQSREESSRPVLFVAGVARFGAGHKG